MALMQAALPMLTRRITLVIDTIYMYINLVKIKQCYYKTTKTLQVNYEHLATCVCMHALVQTVASHTDNQLITRWFSYDSFWF